MENILDGTATDMFPQLEGKRGVLFSSQTLDQFIKEEAVHDNFALSEAEKRSIRTFSSGEQRKALLNFLFNRNPEFLILDNAFDMLDRQAQADLNNYLEEISSKIPILQIYRRKDNLLPFISQAIEITNEKLTFSGSVSEYFRINIETERIAEIEYLPPPPFEIESPANPLVEFKNVSVKYGDRTIVNNINWRINKGDFWQLTGPNGSGKSTLLSMITGDNPKAYGQDITIFGKKKGSGESIWEIKKKIGYVTPSMTTMFRGWNSVEKMVVSGLVDSIGLYQKPTGYQIQLANKWIDAIGLGNVKHTRFKDLTEGQQCMVLIARSMIKHPPLLILDEPSHGLNDADAELLSQLVNRIAEEGKTTILYVSHRKEPGLHPKSVFELFPAEEGSAGKEIFSNVTGKYKKPI